MGFMRARSAAPTSPRERWLSTTWAVTMPAVENKESSARRPDELALLGELSGQVQTALTKLSPDLREAVILRDLQQLEYGEIQRVLSVPEGTVKSRINRGRIELARILQQMGVRPS